MLSARLHRTPAGARYDDLLAVARGPRTRGFDGSSGPTTTWRWATGDGLPGPQRRLDDARRAGPGHDPDPARHPGQRRRPSGSRPCWRSRSPRSTRCPAAGSSSGLGAGWFEAEHRAYGMPVPAQLGERFDRLEEQLEIVTGLWSTPVGERYYLRRRALPADRLPALPKPVQPPVPLIIGGGGKRRTPHAGRAVRHRVQHRLLHRRRGRGPSTTGSGAAAPRRAGTRRRCVCPGPARRSSAGTTPRSPAGLPPIGAGRRRAAPRTGCAARRRRSSTRMGAFAALGVGRALPAAPRPRRPRPRRPRRERGPAAARLTGSDGRAAPAPRAALAAAGARRGRRPRGAARRAAPPRRP